jgi:hypothetical protein
LVDPNWSVDQALRNAELAKQVRDLNNELELRYRESQVREDQARVANQQRESERESYSRKGKKSYYADYTSVPEERVELSRGDTIAITLLTGMLLLIVFAAIIIPRMR